MSPSEAVGSDDHDALVKEHAAAKHDAAHHEDAGRPVPTGLSSTIPQPASNRDVHGFRTDMGNRKARRAAWAKTRKIRARFEALINKEAAR